MAAAHSLSDVCSNASHVARGRNAPVTALAYAPDWDGAGKTTNLMPLDHNRIRTTNAGLRLNHTRWAVRYVMRIGMPHENPRVTPPERLRFDCCVLVTSTIEPEGEVGIREIGGGVVCHDDAPWRVRPPDRDLWLARSGVHPGFGDASSSIAGAGDLSQRSGEDATRTADHRCPPACRPFATPASATHWMRGGVRWCPQSCVRDVSNRVADETLSLTTRTTRSSFS